MLARPCGLLLAASLILSVSAVAAKASVFEEVGKEVGVLFENGKPAVVKVRSEGGHLNLSGSGFFIDDKGTVLTAECILGENLMFTVEMNGDGKRLPAKLVGRDRRSGVAVLQVDVAKTPFLTFAHSGALKTGGAVITIGYPLNLPAAPNFGLVSGFDYRYLDRYFPTTHIRCNLPISPGQVGGPLLNTDGKVVGLVVTAVEEGKGIYALPIEAAAKITEDFRKYGRARFAWVGVGMDGMQISQLFEGTPAAGSGLGTGDVVKKIGDREIKSPADVLDASFFSKVGDTVTVTVDRKGKTLKFPFVIQERPAPPEARPSEPVTVAAVTPSPAATNAPRVISTQAPAPPPTSPR